MTTPRSFRLLARPCAAAALLLGLAPGLRAADPAVGALTLEPTATLVTPGWLARAGAANRQRTRLARQAELLDQRMQAAADADFHAQPSSLTALWLLPTEPSAAVRRAEAASDDDTPALSLPAADAAPAAAPGYSHAAFAADGFAAPARVFLAPDASSWLDGQARVPTAIAAAPLRPDAPPAYAGPMPSFAETTAARRFPSAAVSAPGVIAARLPMGNTAAAVSPLLTAATAPATSSLAAPAALPGGVAQLYVAEYVNGNVRSYDSSGNNTSTTAQAAPYGMAISTAGSLYVGSFSASSIFKYTASTSGTFASSGLPRGLVFDTAGNLYATNNSSSGGGVYRFINTNGTLNSTPTLFASMASPSGLAFDTAGNLFVASTNTNSIVKFTNSGGTLGASGATFASLPGVFPYQIAFDPAGDLFVTGNQTNSIIEFINSNGTLSSTATTFASGGLISLPRGLAFDPAGNLYLGNYGTGGTATSGSVIKFPFSNGTLSTTGTTLVSGIGAITTLTYGTVIDPVPEPATWAGGALLLVASGLVLRRRGNARVG